MNCGFSSHPIKSEMTFPFFILSDENEIFSHIIDILYPIESSVLGVVITLVGPVVLISPSHRH